jgi:hypothetical protein
MPDTRDTPFFLEYTMRPVTRTLVGLAVGLAVGGLLGVALVMIFAPFTGKAFTDRLRESYAISLREAREASERKRRELEADLRLRSGL